MGRNFDPHQILRDSLRESGCKGALLAISEDGAIKTYSAGTISANDHHRPYYIYSISKSFTAVAIMRLCEDRGDFLDECFASYFPETKIPPGITVRQLLNHTGGLSDYFSCPEYQTAVKNHPTRPWTYEKLMEFGLKQTPLFEPGTGWAYSNPGYALLKELIERKSVMNYYEYLEEVIIQKIPLSHTRPFLKTDQRRELLESEDDLFAGDFRRQYHPGWIATGSFISTASDVARFYDSLFGGRLVSSASLTQMTKTVDVLPNHPAESIPSYGLGLMHEKNSPFGDAYGHGGGGPGYTTYATHFPKLEGHRVSISLVLNKSLPQTPFALAHNLISHYLETQG